MKLETKEQWRQAVIERRIEKIRRGSVELDQVVDKLIGLRNVEDWMVAGLLDAAAEEWEARIRDFIAYYDSMLAQAKPSKPTFQDPVDLPF